MSFGSSTSQDTIPKFKSFVSESELEDRRKKRQEEWEKVRKEDDPVEAPEEEYDPRSLFERLEEQRLKKQADYEEAHKLKNMIRGLDDDEVTFLEYVDMRKQEIELQRMKEDMQEIEEYRKAVATLSEEALEAKRLELKKSTGGVPTSGQGKKSQLSLLSGAVKRKCADTTNDAEKKQRANSSVERHGPCDGDERSQSPGEVQVQVPRTALHCLGVLPGLGVYTDSSDSENSSFSDEADLELDLVGRRRPAAMHQAERSPKPN
uniref:FAM192A/Fyv6 N-terminal domain-containing protein n=1 Tax=Amblyomma maculatum TaxID=34609 RepID=G3MPV8_AMBMU